MNAILEADTIDIDTGNQTLVIDGTVRGDDITLQGSAIAFDSSSTIEGRVVTISQIDQVGEHHEIAAKGGKITAKEKLTLTAFSRFEDLIINTPHIVGTDASIDFHGNTQINGLDCLEIKGTTSIYGEGVKFNDNNHINTVIFQEKTNASHGPRLQNHNGKMLSIGTLVVHKTTNANGQVITSNLIDKSSPTEAGLTTFKIGQIDILDDAKLTVYADKKSGEQTNIDFGTVNIGAKAELQLGWRASSYTALNSKSIDHLVLSDSASVTIDKREGKNQPIEADIQKITFAGNNAKVETTLIGKSTEVLIKENVKQSTLADVETEYLNVFVEKTGQNTLTVDKVADATQVTVAGAPANNSGNAINDLKEVANSVNLGTKNEFKVEQQADDIYDGATGTAKQNADGTQSIGNVQKKANANINGIAEMTALGLHIWRNDINDMNKRLGELRDSNADANGVWARVYNGKAKFGNQNITNKYTAFQFGYDHQVADGTWLGGALSWTDGNNDFAVGGGDSSLLAFTGYGSKLWDNGMFLDVTGKFGRMKNEFDISLASGKSSASYHTNAVSVSAEAGWRLYPMQNSFYVEPQVELMYGHVFGVDYSTSTGVNVEQDSADTLIGRAGVVLGLKCPDNRGNAYLRASVLHDWKGDADFTFSKTSGQSRTISEELGGTWFEYGIGANFNATKQVHLYADVEAANGGEVDTDYRVNFGVRYSY